MTPSPRVADPTEIEWQFDALDLRPVERWLETWRTWPETASLGLDLVGDPARRIVDVYLDTADWRVGRCGFVLRIRRRTGGDEVTLKDTAPARDGLRRRLEVTEALPAGGLEALGAAGPVGRRLHALLGRRPLAPVLEVRTRRRPWTLTAAGSGAVAEFALDDTVIELGADVAPVRLRRVEVELSGDSVDHTGALVGRLRQECGLQPASLSKYEAGLLASGRNIPPSPDLGPTDVTPLSTVGEVAFAVLRRNMIAMIDNEPGTRLGEDPEALHDMRVATRRMRAALSLFAEALPARSAHLRDELGWLAGVLGAVRDLDVHIERVDEWAEDIPETDRGSLDDLKRVLETQRDGARAQMLDALESPRYERMVRGFTTLLRQGPSRRNPEARTLAVLAGPDLIFQRHRSVHKAARLAERSHGADDFHRLRIRCKRLRYALEFVRDVYPGATADYLSSITKVQDLLGLMQDADVALARLGAMARDESLDLSRAAVFTMGEVAQRHRHELARLHDQAPDRIKRLKGSSWRRLARRLEQVRSEAALRSGWKPPLRIGAPSPTDAAAATAVTPPVPSSGPPASSAAVVNGSVSTPVPTDPAATP
ncbi:MAG: CYTH and CHAD domain-containing protein [Acidimicrobiales bacterium]